MTFFTVQAILFLAPLAFNQSLEEDSRVNRLVRVAYSIELLPCEYFAQEDSLTLWRDICGNKLLASANLILFFNKVDLQTSSLHYSQFTLAQKDVLNATLAAGVSVKKFVPSYGNLPNDVPHVTKCWSCKLFYASCSHLVSVLQISKKSSETIMLVLLSCP